MFFSTNVLTKKGPLGRIWVAAHEWKKLKRSEVAGTDIHDSVENILHCDVPIALRTSGHLLLGVVRIYSEKVQYLLTDCTEATMKIKLQFTTTLPNRATLTEEESVVARNTVTVQPGRSEVPSVLDLDVDFSHVPRFARAVEDTPIFSFFGITSQPASIAAFSESMIRRGSGSGSVLDPHGMNGGDIVDGFDGIDGFDDDFDGMGPMSMSYGQSGEADFDIQLDAIEVARRESIRAADALVAGNDDLLDGSSLVDGIGLRRTSITRQSGGIDGDEDQHHRQQEMGVGLEGDGEGDGAPSPVPLMDDGGANMSFGSPILLSALTTPQRSAEKLLDISFKSKKTPSPHRHILSGRKHRIAIDDELELSSRKIKKQLQDASSTLRSEIGKAPSTMHEEMDKIRADRIAQPSEKLFREIPCVQDADLTDERRNKLLFAFPFAPAVTVSSPPLKDGGDDTIEVARGVERRSSGLDADVGLNLDMDLDMDMDAGLDVPDFMDDFVGADDDVQGAADQSRRTGSLASAAPDISFDANVSSLSVDEIAHEETGTFDALLPQPGGRKQAAKLFFNLLLMQMKGDVVMQQDAPFSQIHIHRSS
eukprot:TRINITY_DN1712_c0_g1_i1.p1 TRINITY_DN1712_c0_g1~~TRINITY_DN1712_c0_g1_i1.p1  ORF type:complete len:593 (+),score=201.07 TRINITY_DN1712_c0_g1_i1:85-1863(+)